MQTAEEEIAARYQEFWDVVVTANAPPDPASSLLPAVLSGPMLEQAVAETASNASLGLGMRLPEGSVSSVSDVQVVVAGSMATLTACVVDDAVIYDLATGTVLNDRVTSGRTEATAALTESGWRITSNNYVKRQEGANGCAD